MSVVNLVSSALCCCFHSLCLDLFKNTLKPLKIDNSITEKNKNTLFKPLGDDIDKMGFEDYLGRKMVLQRSTFDRHTKGDYLNPEKMRHKIFPHIEDVLKNPSEVWLSEYSEKVFQSTYTKYYKDAVIVVIADITRERKQFKQINNLKIRTWIKLEINTEDSRRKGILIKGKDL